MSHILLTCLTAEHAPHSPIIFLVFRNYFMLKNCNQFLCTLLWAYLWKKNILSHGYHFGNPQKKKIHFLHQSIILSLKTISFHEYGWRSVITYAIFSFGLTEPSLDHIDLFCHFDFLVDLLLI